MCNVVHAYMMEGLDGKAREEQRLKLYVEPGLIEAVERLNKAKGG